MTMTKADFKNNLNGLSVSRIKELLEAAFERPEVAQENDGTYIDVYADLLAFTKKCVGSIDASTLVGLAHMVYGWMPTVLKKVETPDDELCRKIRLVVETSKPDDDVVEGLMKVTNNSIVGASKLLHFINPDVYPIYDSRVFRSAMNSRDIYDTDTKDTGFYIAYAQHLCHLASNNKAEIEGLRALLKEHKYLKSETDFSDIRVLELSLYIAGKPTPRKKSKK